MAAQPQATTEPMQETDGKENNQEDEETITTIVETEGQEEEEQDPLREDQDEPMEAPPSPRKSPRRAAPKETSGAKKESFQWNTPADEFADDVASDAEEEGELLGGDNEEEEDDLAGSPIAAEIDGEHYEAHRTADGGIVIHLGVEEADRFAVSADNIKGETNEDIQKFLENYKREAAEKKKKKQPSKQKFQCPKCDKIWNWPWELRRHVLTHYKEKERQQTSTYKCEECGRGFQWKRDLAQHKRLHTGEKLLVCSVCEKKFTTRQALLHHVVVHTGEKPFQCALCGNRFTQPANLRTHMKKKHNTSSIKNNKCPHCQENFPSIIAVHQHILEDHQNIVAEEREEQDIIKMKKDQERVEREIRREENRRKREERRKERIDYNDFRAKGLQEWEINYEFHIGEGLVRGVDWDRTPSNGNLCCEICDRRFGWRYEVMFHNLCHQNDEQGNTKNRVCPECDTAFKVPIGLKHHLLLHTGELPFLCLHCWRSFSSHIDLKLHIRKEHLSHLEPPKPVTPKKTPKIKTERKSYSKKFKQESQQHLSIFDEPVPEQQQQQQQPQQLVAVAQDSSALSENVELMVANQQGENGESQTILVNSDGTIVHTGDQDMIVVIQSDDMDQSQGLIVVDPSQLQQVVGADGMPVTLVEAGSGETMILEDDNSAKVLVSHQQPDGTTSYTLAPSVPSTTTESSALATSTSVTMTDSGKIVLAEEGTANGDTTTTTTTMIVADATEDEASVASGTIAVEEEMASPPVNGVEALTAAASVVSEETKVGIVSQEQEQQ